ncbi:MAG: hypothetical protein WDN69_11590 [Aliidongia sp.]
MVKYGAILLMTALLAAGPAFASGGEESSPWALDENGGPPAEQAAFYDGNTGVLMGQSPWGRLFGAWRLLHGMPIGKEAGEALSHSCCEQSPQRLADAVSAWLAARQEVPGVATISYLETDRDIGDLYGVPNCFADAFDTAAKTLADRSAQYGKEDRWVHAWLDGQDAVFASCHDDAALPALPDGAPDWLKADHAYQAAARSLYRREFGEAATQFRAIAQDAASPWHSTGTYLALRAEIRGAIHAQSTADYAKAKTELASLTTAGGYGSAELPKLAGMIDFRLAPDERRTRLAASLLAPTLGAGAAADFKDLRRLGPKPPGMPEFLDWIADFGRDLDAGGSHFRDEPDQIWKTDAEARSHALDRWRAGKDPAWLIAALAATAPTDKESGELAEAAHGIAAGTPPYLTTAFHRIRLTAASGDAAVLRDELDAILKRKDLSVTTRNLFLAERIQFAETPARFAEFAARPIACPPMPDDTPPGSSTCDSGYRGNPTQGSDLGTDAVALIDRMDLETRAELSRQPALDAGFRLDIALTGWVRAVLAQNDAVTAALAGDLKTELPQLAAEWQSYLDAKTPEDKRFAAYFILAKVPGAAIDLGSGNYTRPTGTVAEFQGHWPDWQFVPAGRPAPATAPPTEPADTVCLGLCGPAAFPLHAPDFVAAGAAKAAEERARYSPADAAKPSATDIWEEVLAYAGAHPKDPRAPEALYWLVRISRFGTGHNHSSHRAYDLLKAGYPASDWAKKTKYYYD